MTSGDDLYEARYEMARELWVAMGYEASVFEQRVAESEDGLGGVWRDALTQIRSLQMREGGLERARLRNEALLKGRKPPDG